MHDHKVKNIRVCVITISDTRTKENDESGKIIIELLEKAGHTISAYEVIRDDAETIEKTVMELAGGDTDVIITTGGTGISRRDNTPEAVIPLLEKQLPGFGELFRHVSYKEVGTKSLLSRAFAGSIGEKLVFCLPGSRNAVRTGLEKVILPELGHILWEVRK